MATKKKGQSAIEFVMLVGAVFFFFLIFLSVIQISNANKTNENKGLVLREITLTIQNEINLAAESIDGYYREFYIPEKILGSDYEINVTEGIVYVRTLDNKHALVLPTAEVNGNARLGDNIIRKENGQVFLNIE